MILASTANAMRMVPLSIDQLTSKAQLVLHGKVTGKTVQRDAEGRIYTRIEMEVTDTWKGTATNRFVMVQGGGVLGEEVASVSGQAEFLINEEVVVFLVLNQRREGVVIGLVQGKFKVTKEASGEKMVHNVFHGVPSGEKSHLNEKSNAARLSLEQLKQRVQGGGR